MLYLVYFSIGLLVLYVCLRTERKKGKPLPRPKGWPIVGLGFELTQENVFNKLSQYAYQYGDMFAINLFGNNVVVLNSAELIRTCLHTDPYKRYMNDRAKIFYGETLLFGSQTMAFLDHAYGPKHSDLRKCFTRAMHVYGEGRGEFEEVVSAELSYLMEKIESYGCQEFNFQKLLKHSLENITASMLSGHALETDEEFQVVWDFDRAEEFFVNPKTDSLMAAFPFLLRIPSIYKDRLAQMLNAKESMTKMFYTGAKKSYKEGVVRGIIDVLIREQIHSNASGEDVLYSDERIIATIVETLAAGVVTTFTTLSSMLLCLMKHPECQVKVQEEIDREIGTGRRPTFADKPHCPMAEAVTCETFRYTPVLPGLPPHVCNSDIELEGFDIPKNTTIIPNVLHVQRDETVWGDPCNFRPERFLDDNGEILPIDHVLRKSLLNNFGYGRRQRLMEPLARSRVFLLLTTLLQRWNFELIQDNQTSSDPRVDDFDWNLNLRPKPYYCRVIPRKMYTESRAPYYVPI